MKKTKKTSDASSTDPRDTDLAGAIRDSAQQIWLAGLGAFSKAQEEGGKVFDALVREGQGLHKRTRAATEEKIGEVTGRFGKVAGDLSKQATASWDRLEQVFEDRVARALTRLGVPTRDEVQALIERVDALNASVQALGGKPVATRTAARRRSTAAPAKVAPKPAGRRTSRTTAAATPAAMPEPAKAVKPQRATRASKASKASGPVNASDAQ